MKGITLLVAMVAGFTWAIGNAAYGQDATALRLIEEDVRIPASGGHYTIAARILRPEGAGPKSTCLCGRRTRSQLRGAPALVDVGACHPAERRS